MRGKVQMYMRIIYPSTLIAIGGTALCLEQKNLGSETETGPVEQTGMRATIITKSTRERHSLWRIFQSKRGISKSGVAYFSLFDSK
jgi:hypothetical protein